MDGDKISKIEVLSHGETAGVSDPAFQTSPDAIIQAQSTDVERGRRRYLLQQGHHRSRERRPVQSRRLIPALPGKLA